MPAVSESSQRTPPKFNLTLKTSRVVPGTSETIAISSLLRRFNRVDFPLLGGPIKDIFIPSRSLAPSFELSTKDLRDFTSFLIEGTRADLALLSKTTPSSSTKSMDDSTKTRNDTSLSITPLTSLENSPTREL